MSDDISSMQSGPHVEAQEHRLGKLPCKQTFIYNRTCHYSLMHIIPSLVVAR